MVNNPKDHPDIQQHMTHLLTKWGKMYKYYDRKEIKKLAGELKDSAIGRGYKRLVSANNIFGYAFTITVDDERYRALNRVILSMHPQTYHMIHTHYVKKPRDLSLKKYAKQLGMGEATYKRYLSHARKEFVLRGGLRV